MSELMTGICLVMDEAPSGSALPAKIAISASFFNSSGLKPRDIASEWFSLTNSGELTGVGDFCIK